MPSGILNVGPLFAAALNGTQLLFFSFLYFFAVLLFQVFFGLLPHTRFLSAAIGMLASSSPLYSCSNLQLLFVKGWKNQIITLVTTVSKIEV